MAAALIRTRTPGVYRRGSRWVATYRVNGRQCKESAATYEQARRIKLSRESSKTSRGRGPTLCDYTEGWLGRLDARGSLRPTSRADYEQRLRRWVLPVLGDKRLDGLGRSDLAQLVERLAADGLGPQSVRAVVTALRACLRSAAEDGLVEVKLAAGLQLPRLDSDMQRCPTREDVLAFLETVDSDYRPLFELLATTGLRISEALGLRWGDLVLVPTASVRVERAWVRGRLHQPKSAHGARVLPLSDDLAQRLLAQRKHGVGAYIFSNKNGRPLDPANLRKRVLRPAADTLGLDLGFHSFRHFAASALCQKRGVKAAQEWLGHHSPSFTLATYVHLLDQDLGEPLLLSENFAHGHGERAPRAANFQFPSARNAEGRKKEAHSRKKRKKSR